MADFDDITGWREELKAFEESEEGRQFFAKRAGSKQKMLVTDALELAGLYFKFDCLLDAIEKKAHWERVGLLEVDENPDHPDWERLHPEQAMATVIDFKNWYAMKKSLYVDFWTLRVGSGLAAAIVSKEVKDLQSEEAIKWLEEKYSRYVDFTPRS